jgi:aminopeptidase
VDVNATIGALAELAVVFGANVQPGQIVAVGSEPGKEPLARAVAEAAYGGGARFVEVTVFDPYVKRARLLHADRDTLGFVPSWLGERVRRLGEERAASVALTGPSDPRVMDGIDPALLGIDLLPRLRETAEVVERRLLNWTAVPCPTPDWAALVHPELPGAEALERLWEEIAHVCRLNEPDPAGAWRSRQDRLVEVGSRLSSLALDSLRLQGPGTDLTVGLLPGSRWMAARLETESGIVHVPNIPTEEVFTSPDPERVDGTVSATKPLFVSGRLITGLRMRFEGGRAVAIDADSGAETLRTMSARDEGAARLGEIALVDRDSRVGKLETVFCDTLLDENAASHLALGHGFGFVIGDEAARGRVNRSEIHVDFMIGSDEVAVTGTTTAGERVPLLSDGAWQI